MIVVQGWGETDVRIIAELTAIAGKMDARDRQKAADVLSSSSFAAAGSRPSAMSAGWTRLDEDGKKKWLEGVVRTGNLKRAITEIGGIPADNGTPVPGTYKEEVSDFTWSGRKPRIPGPVANAPAIPDMERRVKKLAADKNEGRRKKGLMQQALQMHDARFRNMYASPEIAQTLSQQQLFRRRSVIDEAVDGTRNEDSERRRLATMTDAEIEIDIDRGDVIGAMTEGKKEEDKEAELLNKLSNPELNARFLADDNARYRFSVKKEQRRDRVRQLSEKRQIEAIAVFAAIDKSGRLARDVVNMNRSDKEKKKERKGHDKEEGLRGIMATASSMARRGMSVEVDEALGPEKGRDLSAFAELADLAETKIAEVRPNPTPIARPAFQYPRLQASEMKIGDNPPPSIPDSTPYTESVPAKATDLSKPGLGDWGIKPEAESAAKPTVGLTITDLELMAAEARSQMPEAPAAVQARAREVRDSARTARMARPRPESKTAMSMVGGLSRSPKEESVSAAAVEDLRDYVRVVDAKVNRAVPQNPVAL
jgi:hypothetical protein